MINRLLKSFEDALLSNEQIITMMREDGITYREITKYTSWTREQVATFSLTLPTSSLPLSMAATNKAPEGYVRCAICIKLVKREEMPTREHMGVPIYHLLACNECLSVESKENALAAKSLARRLAHKEKATRKENQVSVEQIPYGYFAFLYKKQKGLCFYTDRPLNFNTRDGLQDTLSTDRIIYNGSYEQGNIVFAINKVNVMKNDMTLEEMKEWTPKWYERIQNYYQTKEEYLLEVENG